MNRYLQITNQGFAVNHNFIVRILDENLSAICNIDTHPRIRTTEKVERSLTEITGGGTEFDYSELV